MRSGLWSLASCLIVVSLFAPSLLAADAPLAPATPELPKSDGGDTAWMLISTALVLLMVPGLALFYGGMVRRKNILGTMMHSMVALGLVGVHWLLIGYALAFGTSLHGFIGFKPELIGLQGVLPGDVFPGTKIPVYVHCMFQGMFAILTPALISGALAERIRFAPYCLFVLLWTTLVYDPLAHWVWAVAPTAADPSVSEPVGWLGAMGALDFAGGTVVHIAAGFSALAAILLLPKRRGYPEHAMHPSSMVLTLTGAGLLWFGWFGFNGGSAVSAGSQAALAFTATQSAAAGAALSWLLVEWLHRGKPTALGLASGLVAGLVAVTPASGFVSPTSALLMGLISGAICYASVLLKTRIQYDDSLDAFGIHGVGGFLGAILTGVFASWVLWNNAVGNPSDKMADLGAIQAGWPNGLLAQVSIQLLASLVAAGYAFVVTLILVKVLDSIWGFALTPEQESLGLDRVEHGEVGFDFGGAALDEIPEMLPPEPRPANVPPNGKARFTVVVEGPPQQELLQAWSNMCQVGLQPPSPHFRAVYPYLTTVQGNRFRFRGGDRTKMRAHLLQLFSDSLGASVRAHVEDS